MTRLLSATSIVFVCLTAASPLHAQKLSAPYHPPIPPVAQTISLAGPRYGFTFLDNGVVEKLREEDIVVKNGISQFGWQFERQFFTTASGPTVLNEWVVLLGGLDQGVALPSVNWLVGLRSREGAEFGIGPNITPVGVALALAAGVSFRAGALTIPMNFAVVPSKAGVRVSMLSGFTIRR
jgi:hypothetical protein